MFVYPQRHGRSGGQHFRWTRLYIRKSRSSYYCIYTLNLPIFKYLQNSDFQFSSHSDSVDPQQWRTTTRTNKDRDSLPHPYLCLFSTIPSNPTALPSLSEPPAKKTSPNNKASTPAPTKTTKLSRTANNGQLGKSPIISSKQNKLRNQHKFPSTAKSSLRNQRRRKLPWYEKREDKSGMIQRCSNGTRLIIDCL